MPDTTPLISEAPEDRHAEIVARLLAWAEGEENIRAIVQTGSATRAPGTPIASPTEISNSSVAIP